MIVGPVNASFNFTRRVVIGNDRMIFIDPAPNEGFSAHVGSVEEGGDTGAPRDTEDRTTMYVPKSGLFPFGGANVGDRFADVRTGDEWEVVDESSDVRSGFAVVYQKFAAVLVEKLYPYIVAVERQDGSVVYPEARFAIWQTGESQGDRGRYESYSAETSPEFASLLVDKNLRVRTGEDLFRVTSATRAEGEPRINVELRQSG